MGRLQSLLDAAGDQVGQLAEAVGLATVLKPTMVMRADDPLGMMQEVVAHCDLAPFVALAAAADKLNVRCHQSGSTVIDPPTELGAARFWQAVREIKAALAHPAVQRAVKEGV